MDAINTLRAVLVGGAMVAMVVAAMHGLWRTVGLLAVGLMGHAWLWVQLSRTARPAGPGETGSAH